jgi:hypothetical protein
MRYQKLKDDIETIEDQPMPYGALRVVAFATNIIGWLVIVIHLLITAVVIHPYLRNKYDETLPALLLTALALFAGLLVGIFIIAQAQIIELMLDIRNDLHLTRRYVRRFGLHIARNIEPTPGE